MFGLKPFMISFILIVCVIAVISIFLAFIFDVIKADKLAEICVITYTITVCVVASVIILTVICFLASKLWTVISI